MEKRHFIRGRINLSIRKFKNQNSIESYDFKKESEYKYYTCKTCYVHYNYIWILLIIYVYYILRLIDKKKYSQMRYYLNCPL